MIRLSLMRLRFPSAASRYVLVAALALAAAVGCDRTAPTASSPEIESQVAGGSGSVPTVRFADVTEASGVRSVYRNGEESDQSSIVESLGGGVGILDYDRDGRFDVFLPGGGTIEPGEPLSGLPGTFWKNVGDVRFVEVASRAQIEAADHYTHGCAMGDFDSDGFPDVVVTGYGGLQFFRNQGDGTFVECAESRGLEDRMWSSSAAWGDYDGDGNLDLYVAHYADWSWENNPRCAASTPGVAEICGPHDFEGLPDAIYYSNGDGTFRRAAQEIGLAADGKGLGVVAVDIDLDSQLDIYVANDTTNNFLYLNEGGGRFRETGVISGTALDQRGISNGSMGLAILDYDSDQRPDIFVTNYENETFALYKNDGGGNFRCITERTGITALGTLYVGFGTVAGDFDRSGTEDLVVANGHVMKHPKYSTIEQSPLYMSNEGGQRLVHKQLESSSYFRGKYRGRGVVTADLNRDGDLDLVFSHTNQPAAVLVNESDNAGHWIILELVGRNANRDAIGARVVLQTSTGTYARGVVGGGSYLSQNPYQLHWGLPAGTEITEATITWPDGSVQTLNELSVDRVHTLVQPKQETSPK